MKKRLVPMIATSAGVLGLAAILSQTPALAGDYGGSPTTKVTYPTTTKVTYPPPHKPPPKETTTTTVFKPPHKPPRPPHRPPRPPHMTTTTFPGFPTTTFPEETTTLPEETTTLPEESTTTLPGATTTTLPGSTTTVPVNRTILTLAARVIGGPATVADFTLDANGPVSLSGITNRPGVTLRVVPPGFYALSFREDALAMDPYTASGWDCRGSAETTPESATLDAGEDALCVITFTETGTTVPTTPTVPGAPVTPVPETISPVGSVPSAAVVPEVEPEATSSGVSGSSSLPVTG